jgi:hypothetical protein
METSALRFHQFLPYLVVLRNCEIQKDQTNREHQVRSEFKILVQYGNKPMSDLSEAQLFGRMGEFGIDSNIL